MRTFQAKIPISKELGPELEHMGLIIYLHDRESCPGCAANRVIQEETKEAILEMARKVDDMFIGEKHKGRRA